jgi:molybdopterin/thiamine biosynthesis adenylyltransferase
LLGEGNQALFRIASPQRNQLERHLFQRYPHREWGTFFSFGYRRTSSTLILSYVDGVWPNPGDLDRQVALTRFRDQYSRRAFQSSAEGPLAIGVVHSHPEGFATFPSALDDDMDLYFAQEFSAFGKGSPYASLIFQRSSTGGFTFTGRVYDRGQWLSVNKLLVIGETIESYQTELMPTQDIGDTVSATKAESTTARLSSLIGDASARRLRNAVVGVVGCSGTGSPAVHVLARAGVGEFVLADPQRFGRSNLERLHGATWDDAQADKPDYKVQIMSRLIRSINPSAKITALAGNILHENVFDELLRCDLLLGCTDTQHGRAALSDASQLYLVPSLDAGILMEGKAGRIESQITEIDVFSPLLPCAFCASRIDTAEMAVELMTDAEKAIRREQAKAAAERGDDPDQYWRHRPRQLHTVGYLATMTGAMLAGYAEGWLTGAFAPPHPTVQFDIGRERFGVVAPPRLPVEGCTCASIRGWADQARSYRNVVLPPHWSKRGQLISRT